MWYNETEKISDCIERSRHLMQNPYLTNLRKIEFVITYACTGHCIHCSEGEHTACGEHIDAHIAADAVREIADAYPIETVMTFGGEPLLYPDTVCAIHSAARERNIPKRQIITNGYFTKHQTVIRDTVKTLADSGVNHILLSVDAFHQRTIPLEVVRCFAEEVQKQSIPLRLQPAWLVSREHDNPYNIETRTILDSFSDISIPVGGGNVIFPAGNALQYLAEYFSDSHPENPYIEDPSDMRCVSFDPTGAVLGGNVYQQDIMAILQNYRPAQHA